MATYLWLVGDVTFLVVAGFALPLLCRYKVCDVGVVALVGEGVLALDFIIIHSLLNLDEEDGLK